MRKSIALLGAAAALALAPLTATSAHATPTANCPSGYFCLFENANGTGAVTYLQVGSSNLGPSGTRAGAYWNRTSDNWALFAQPGFSGVCFRTLDHNLHELPPGLYKHVGSLQAGDDACAQAR